MFTLYSPVSDGTILRASTESLMCNLWLLLSSTFVPDKRVHEGAGLSGGLLSSCLHLPALP